MKKANLCRDSLRKSAFEMSCALHEFSAMKRHIEVGRYSSDPVLRDYSLLIVEFADDASSEALRFRKFVQSLAPQEREVFERWSYRSLAALNLVHYARLYAANVRPIAIAALPLWAVASIVDDFNHTWQLGALTAVVALAVGYRAMCRDPYYAVGAQARKEMDKVFSNEAD